jgi:hypothetical protein
MVNMGPICLCFDLLALEDLLQANPCPLSGPAEAALQPSAVLQQVCKNHFPILEYGWQQKFVCSLYFCLRFLSVALFLPLLTFVGSVTGHAIGWGSQDVIAGPVTNARERNVTFAPSIFAPTVVEGTSGFKIADWGTTIGVGAINSPTANLAYFAVFLTTDGLMYSKGYNRYGGMQFQQFFRT